jgi:general secretion pathway protein M
MDHQEQSMKTVLANTWFEFWGERTPREKTLLTAGAVLLCLVVFYSVLWAPAQAGRARLSEQLPAMRTELARMSAQANEARGLASNAQSAAPTGGALRDAVGASLVQHGIAGADVSNLGNAVQVRLKNVSFGAWVGWLDDVRKQYKIQVVDMHATAHAAPNVAAPAAALDEDGQVDLNATLQAPSVQ